MCICSVSAPPVLPCVKAVATDFEVVRPGSGCGLFNVGVVLFALYYVSVKYNGVTMD